MECALTSQDAAELSSKFMTHLRAILQKRQKFIPSRFIQRPDQSAPSVSRATSYNADVRLSHGPKGVVLLLSSDASSKSSHKAVCVFCVN